MHYGVYIMQDNQSFNVRVNLTSASISVLRVRHKHGLNSFYASNIRDALDGGSVRRVRGVLLPL